MKLQKIKKMLLAMACSLTLAGCMPEEVSRTPIDKRFIPEHTESSIIMMTRMVGKTVTAYPMPVTHYYDDTWEILYLIKYEDGEKSEKWIECTEEEFNEFNLES